MLKAIVPKKPRARRFAALGFISLSPTSKQAQLAEGMGRPVPIVA